MQVKNLQILLKIIEILVYICIITIPLALWKIIEIILFIKESNYVIF